jgi:outer membrane protein, heavy metal efflux system
MSYWTRLVVFAVCILGSAARAEGEASLPSPLRLDDVIRIAGADRAEVEAAKARADAASERVGVVGALEDPMVSPSLDHLPFMLMGADWSVTIEQQFPLSGILGHRRRVAEAETARLKSDTSRTRLDVQADAARAYLMVYEQRELLRILREQEQLAKELLAASNARYRSGTGAQADVIRSEIEIARIAAALKSTQAQAAAAEVMLNTSLGRSATQPVPLLEYRGTVAAPPPADVVIQRVTAQRPELAAGRAEVRRAEAEIDVMKSMYLPMGMVRMGPAYTMTDGMGVMAMVGISIPLWRGKLSSGVAEAEAMARMARADLEAMRRMAEGEAAGARQVLLAARERWLALRDDVLPRARQAVGPTLASYGSGQLPLVSVVEALRTLWMTQAELLEAEVALGTAWTRFGRAIGQLVEKQP